MTKRTRLLLPTLLSGLCITACGEDSTTSDPVATASPRTTMLPSADVLPDVLPTGRLAANGKPVPDLRADLRIQDDANTAILGQLHLYL